MIRKRLVRCVMRFVIPLVGLAMVVSGCSFDPASVRVPGATVSGDTYRLHIQFANVLNLPRGAKVIANGVDVGNLTSISIVDPKKGIGAAAPSAGYIVADVLIKKSARLDQDVHAELQQATPLGDVHIALKSPPHDAAGGVAPPLADGATIPIGQTSQAPQIEDTMSGLAAAVTGGAINSLQDTVRQLNTSLPRDPGDTARIFSVVENDIADVGGNVTSVDSILDGLNANAEVLHQDQYMLDPLLTDYGVKHTTDVVTSVVGVILILASLAPVGHNAVWLAPLVQSLDRTAKAVVPVLFSGNPLDISKPSNLSKLYDLIQNKIIPFVDHGPKVNVVDVKMSDTEKTDQIVTSLRMIGAVR